MSFLHIDKIRLKNTHFELFNTWLQPAKFSFDFNQKF